MHTKSLAAVALLGAGLASARALPKTTPVLETRDSSYGQAVYWGSGDSRSLGDYCTDSEGISIIVLAFLDTYGNGATPSGSFGSDCSVDSSGNGSGCDSLASDIATCQSNGVKVFLSIGGGGASGSVTSQADAEGVAWTLWNSYANPDVVDSSAPRPFGDSFVNGWDLDVESNPNGDNQYYEYLVNKLRDYFSTDSENSYYISGAPQCPIVDQNMGDTITNSQFDYLFIQFYNNDYCSAYQYVRNDGSYDAAFNFDAWATWVQGGASSSASLYIGLPASPEASTGYDDDGAKYYLSPDELQSLLGEYKSHSGFGGVMLWDAGESDSINENGCHYDQEVSSVLSSGNTC